jgi:hypothetical protein
MTALAFPARRRVAADLILRTAARGAVLVGVAVVIGIVLLQVIDKGGGGGGGAVPTPNNGQNGGESSTSTSAGKGRSPADVRVLVENGSGLNQAAATLANQLRGQGYAIAGTGNAPLQTGSTVACRAGFEDEATALAGATGAGTTVIAFPATPPAGSENADCISIKGS